MAAETGLTQGWECAFGRKGQPMGLLWTIAGERAKRNGAARSGGGERAAPQRAQPKGDSVGRVVAPAGTGEPSAGAREESARAA